MKSTKRTRVTIENDPPPLAALQGGPEPLRVKLDPGVVVKLVALERDVVDAERVRDTYQEGLVAGLGFEVGRVIGLDLVTGELLVDAG